MKRLFFTLFLLLFAGVGLASAQDVIVLRDGTLIQSRVLKITETEVEYKKFSNLDGPLYTLSKASILAVNFENGEKESFADAAATQPAATPAAPREIEVPADADNELRIAKYNKTLVSAGKLRPKSRLARFYTTKYNYTKGSVLSNRDIEVGIYQQDYMYNCCQYRLEVRNKTDKTIYVDLGSSYSVDSEGEYRYYYDPTKQTSVTHGGAAGGSIGLGAVTNALGVGGVVGTLAQGITVGGGKSNSVSTTYVDQRILVVPPGGKADVSAHKSVEGNDVAHGEDFLYVFNCSVEVNNIRTMTEENSQYRRDYVITYSTDASFNTYSTIKFGLYVHQVIGALFWGLDMGTFKVKDAIYQQLYNYHYSQIIGGGYSGR